MKKRGKYLQGSLQTQNKKSGYMRELEKSRSSQAAIFMIIAAAILLLGLTYFIYQNQFIQKRQLVQPELVPIKTFVENCMKLAADDGLETIGLTGGYITVPEAIGKDPRKYLSSYSDSGFKMPYWWQRGIELTPSEDSIKQQLRQHIRIELKSCLNDFEPLSQSYSIVQQKDPLIDIRFNDEDTTLLVIYPLEVTAKTGDFKANIEDFEYVSQIRFKKVYELAKLIMERENKDFFLEKKTIDLISIDTEIPTTDIEARCKGKVWELANIKDRLRDLLRINVPYIRIKGTDYNPNLYVSNPEGQDIYSKSYFQYHYVWEIAKDAEKKYKNIKVSFTYDNWPLKIYARPSENGILKSNAQKGTEMLKFFCLQIWHFTYDIGYPVLVTIFDMDNEKNKRYQFNFPFMVDIDHNQPNRVYKGTTLFDVASDVDSENYCNDVQNQITVFTVDNSTGEDLKDANLTFVCGRFYCDMGQSDWLSFGAASGISKRLPYCVNGVVKAARDGFMDSNTFVQTDVDGRSYLLFMNPVKEFKNYKVVKHLLSDPAKSQELGKNEKASIYLRSNDTGFEGFAFYPIDRDFPLKLPLGKDITYEVTVYLVDDENVIGGYIGNWKANSDDLRNANEIVFHAITQAQATEDEKFLFVAGLSSYSEKVPAPELK